jgi:hypothetical protein
MRFALRIASLEHLRLMKQRIQLPRPEVLGPLAFGAEAGRREEGAMTDPDWTGDVRPGEWGIIQKLLPEGWEDAARATRCSRAKQVASRRCRRWLWSRGCAGPGRGCRGLPKVCVEGFSIGRVLRRVWGCEPSTPPPSRGRPASGSTGAFITLWICSACTATGTNGPIAEAARA